MNVFVCKYTTNVVVCLVCKTKSIVFALSKKMCLPIAGIAHSQRMGHKLNLTPLY